MYVSYLSGRNFYKFTLTFKAHPKEQTISAEVEYKPSTIHNTFIMETFQFLGDAMRSLMKENVPNYNERIGRIWMRLFEGFIVEQIVIGQAGYGKC